MAMTLAQFRQQYPQYDDKTDRELADALHRKFYSAIPREEFDARIGLLLPDNVASPSQAYTDALAVASASSQVFGSPQQPAATAAPEDWQPDPYFADLPVPGYPGTPAAPQGVSAPSDNIQITGLWENIGAGIDSGANKILGAPVDLPVWLGNSLVNAANSGIEMSGNGRPIPNIPTDLPGSSEGWERTQGNLGFTTPSQVVPADMGQQLARAATEAGTMAAIPELLMMRLGQAGATVLPPAMDATAEIAALLFGQSRTGGEFARNLAVNAAGGAGADAAMEAAPDWAKPYAALAGGLTAAGVTHGVTGIPGAVHNGAGVVADYLAPLTPSGQQRIAGQTIHDAATSPGGVLEALIETSPELVPGSAPTTFQMTGDMGLGALERGVAARNPTEFMQRGADQNMARVFAMENIQPTGAPERVTASARTYLDAIEQQADDAIAASTRRAQDAAQGIGPGIIPEVAGTTMREALEAARNRVKAQERTLWDAVDPDGTLTLGASNARQSAGQIVRSMPQSAKPMAGEEAAIFGVARAYGDVVPFSELTALQSRLKAEMRAERIANGESPAYSRMAQLNSALQKDLEDAIAGKVQQEQRAVEAGHLAFEDTVAAKLRGEVEAFFGERQAQTGGIGGNGIGRYRGSGSAGLPSVRGTEVPQGWGYGNAPSNPGLPSNAGSQFDQAAFDRLSAAQQSTRDRLDTFDNPTLGPIRKRPSTVSPYDMPAGGVPGRIFFPGPKSPEAIARFRHAIGDQQVLPALTGYAIDRLRKTAMEADGTLNPTKAGTWLRQHSEALRAFPELGNSIAKAMNASGAMETVARQQKQRLDDAQLGLVGRLLGTNDPQEVVRIIGSTMARQDAASQIGKLRQAIGNDPQALEGLRKAVADFITSRFIGNTEAATTGIGTIRSNQFQTFVRQKRDALKAAGFTDNELATIQDIARDLQRTNRSISSVRIPGGSNTVQDALAAGVNDSPATLLTKVLMAGGASGIGTSLALGPWVGIPAGIATALVGAWRQAGLQTVDDLVKQAMLDPQLARQLLEKVPAQWERQVGIDTGQAARRAVLNALAASNSQDGEIAQLLFDGRRDPVAEALVGGM